MKHLPPGNAVNCDLNKPDSQKKEAMDGTWVGRPKNLNDTISHVLQF